MTKEELEKCIYNISKHIEYIDENSRVNVVEQIKAALKDTIHEPFHSGMIIDDSNLKEAFRKSGYEIEIVEIDSNSRKINILVRTEDDKC